MHPCETLFKIPSGKLHGHKEINRSEVGETQVNLVVVDLMAS